jgi:ATP-dependent protease ClpP protease subunit
MYQFRHTNKPKQDIRTRNIIIKNDDDEDDDEDDAVTKTITKEHNHIYFHSEVNRDTIFELIAFIRKAEIENIILAHNLSSDEAIPIYLHISSYGGVVFDALTAIDVIKSCKVPVHTIIEGATASAGTLISVVGKKRYIRQNAYMLIHQLSSGAWGKMNELEDEFENNKLVMEKIKAIYKKHANIPKKELNDILKHDLWWEADKCIQYGLVDDIWNRT